MLPGVAELQKIGYAVDINHTNESGSCRPQGSVMNDNDTFNKPKQQNVQRLNSQSSLLCLPKLAKHRQDSLEFMIDLARFTRKAERHEESSRGYPAHTCTPVVGRTSGEAISRTSNM